MVYLEYLAQNTEAYSKYTVLSICTKPKESIYLPHKYCFGKMLQSLSICDFISKV